MTLSMLPIADPADPRAPTIEAWEALTPEERERVVESLPSEWEDALPPEGDRHWVPKVNARQTLQRYFSRMGRSVYVGSELGVYYPAERAFAPDVMVVLDVPSHERERWVVSAEGKGLDWALEIFVSGSRRKDFTLNVERYARLGIPEYFMFDRGRLRLSAWRLSSPGEPLYTPIVPQRGRLESKALGVEVGVVDSRLRFFVADAELPEAEELVARLERAVEGLEQRAEEQAARAEEETERAELEAQKRHEETQRAELEAQKRREAEKRLQEALDELERLRGSRL